MLFSQKAIPVRAHNTHKNNCEQDSLSTILQIFLNDFWLIRIENHVQYLSALGYSYLIYNWGGLGEQAQRSYVTVPLNERCAAFESALGTLAQNITYQGITMSRHLITPRYPGNDSIEDINESSCISRKTLYYWRLFILLPPLTETRTVWPPIRLMSSP